MPDAYPCPKCGALMPGQLVISEAPTAGVFVVMMGVCTEDKLVFAVEPVATMEYLPFKGEQT